MKPVKSQGRPCTNFAPSILLANHSVKWLSCNIPKKNMPRSISMTDSLPNAEANAAPAVPKSVTPSATSAKSEVQQRLSASTDQP